MFIDTHAHINDEKLNAKEIIENMQQNNLSAIFNVSYNLKSAEDTVKLAENENVYGIIGLHPSEVLNLTDKDLKSIKQMTASKKIVAIGEIGLDYHYDNTDKEKQKYWFIKQVKMADELKLPVVIHLRDAYLDFENIILTLKPYLNHGMLMHCYSGSIEFATKLIKEIPNVYFAFGGTLTFKNAKNVHAACANIPLNRLLSETDCPYLTPEPLRGQTLNQPKLVSLVVAKMADLKGLSTEKMAEQIKENVNTFFKTNI